MNTSGNTILITGATSGIGLAFAKEFVLLGNTVILCGRRSERLAQLKETYPHIVTKVCDVADAAQRTALADWVMHEYPGVNMLINNAGIQLAMDLTHPVNLEQLYAEVDTNFIAPVHLTSLFARHLATKQQAAIVNITSGLAFVPIAFMPVYCATKAALHSLTLSLRYQLKDTHIKVFEIAPPSVDTELGHQRRTDKSQSHGGMPVKEFIQGAMEAIEKDILEAPIADARHLREKGETLFNRLNPK